MLLDVARQRRRDRLRPRDHPGGPRHAPRRTPTSTAATGRTSGRWSRSTTPTCMLTRDAAAVPVLRPEAADLHAAALPARHPGSSTAPSATRWSPRAATSTAAAWRRRLSASGRASTSARTIRRSVLLGADYYDHDEDAPGDAPVPTRHRRRTRSLDRVIVDKNARIGRGVRLVERGAACRTRTATNYYIRSGIIIVPKGAVVPDGTTV
ncbi:MAG: hypothetical protein MZV64_42295 [Ignavibacteriales bacterium]|nr:hypothetical protein [Ignavibacteriales bacterium]